MSIKKIRFTRKIGNIGSIGNIGYNGKFWGKGGKAYRKNINESCTYINMIAINVPCDIFLHPIYS